VRHKKPLHRTNGSGAGLKKAANGGAQSAGIGVVKASGYCGFSYHMPSGSHYTFVFRRQKN
jgi:hypothetical protein